jgi:drug/metabolite transporter (DMT)-like permease
MLLEVAGKLLSESLLSLYPSIVRNIPVAMELQLWSRFIAYVGISVFFINLDFVKSQLLSRDGLQLSLITIAHVFVSYQGFAHLESGVSYTIFYLYPIFILLMAGEAIHPIMGLGILGVVLLSLDDSDKKGETTKTKWYGRFMMLLAAITEAMIYFVVRKMKTTNNWNHIFISYFFGAVLGTGLFYDKILRVLSLESALTVSLGLNAVIGLGGYLLRFFAISRLEPRLYAPLSYFGIVMAYIYGVLINGDKITIAKIVGTLCVLAPNVYLVIQ